MLSSDDIDANINDLNNGWELKDGRIIKSFKFESFEKSIEFVTNVATIAEGLNHHPIITINWRTVTLALKTFDVNAITKRDFTLAKEIDKKTKS